MAIYPQSSGAIGTLLRLIQEEKKKAPHVQTPTADPSAPIRASVAAPLETPIAPESPGTARTIAIRPDTSPATSPAISTPSMPGRATPGGIGGPVGPVPYTGPSEATPVSPSATGPGPMASPPSPGVAAPTPAPIVTAPTPYKAPGLSSRLSPDAQVFKGIMDNIDRMRAQDPIDAANRQRKQREKDAQHQRTVSSAKQTLANTARNWSNRSPRPSPSPSPTPSPEPSWAQSLASKLKPVFDWFRRWF